MKILKLKNGTLYNVLYAEPGEILGHGERTLEIGVLLENEKTPLDIENAFKNHASRIELGGKGVDESGGEIPFETNQVFEGFSQIRTYTVNRHFVYDIDQTAEVVQIIMQEPDLKTEVQKTNNDIMMALTEVYEMIIGEV